MIRVEAVLEENRRLAPGVHVLTLASPGWAKAAPGQFAMIRCPGPEPLLARPMAYMTADGDRARFGMKVSGRGTAILSGCAPGTKLVVWGPLGVPFSAPKGKRFVLVGGGIGVPPLVLQAQALVAQGAKIDAVIVGARTGAELFGREELAALGISPVVCTDDGSEGTKGFVTAELEKRALDAETLVQACGPTPMLIAVANLAKARGAKCELSLEARMGCGVGACRGCMIPMAEPSDEKKYLCLCLDGPVVSADAIDLAKLGGIH